MKKLLLFLALGSSAIAAPLSGSFLKDRPALVVMVVVDQFRADYLTRFQAQFLPTKLPDDRVGGLLYLMSNGAYFPYGKYDILQSMTGPGHATVLTGAYPRLSGIPSNHWFDRSLQKEVYCVEDPNSPTVGSLAKNPKGISPKNLRTSTVGDELKNSGNSSRVISIAMKDRAAVLMGGHRPDLALWLESEDKTAQWVSSKHYLQDQKLPTWVATLNQKLKDNKGKPIHFDKKIAKDFSLSLSKSYLTEKKWVDTLGTEFPHQAPHGTFESLTLPLGFSITNDAVGAALDAYQLGSRSSPDLLAVSYSSFDYLGHTYGPNSPEMEEMTLQLDRSISDLLNLINQKVPGGLAKTLIVFTGDHGVAPNPEWLKSQNFPAGRGDSQATLSEIEKALTKKFGKIKGKWISYQNDTLFFLNTAQIKARNLNLEQVQESTKTVLQGRPEFFTAITHSEGQRGQVPSGMIGRQYLKTFDRERSADVTGVLRPFWIVTKPTTDHLTGYAYDSTVPIIFAGPHIRAGIYATPAEVVDIAPTLTFSLGTVAPAASEGRVLEEILMTPQN